MSGLGGKVSQSIDNKATTPTSETQENPERGNLYVVEALDGVGKTSTAKALAEKLGATYMESHDRYFENFKPRIKEDDVSVDTKLAAYLTSNALQGDEIRNRLKNGEDIVIDRFYASTFAFHYAKTGEPPEEHIDKIEEFDIPKPDSFIYLWVDEDERLRRLDKREEDGHKFETDSEFMEEVAIGYGLVGKEDNRSEEINAQAYRAVEGVEHVVDQIIDDHVSEKDLPSENLSIPEALE